MKIAEFGYKCMEEAKDQNTEFIYRPVGNRSGDKLTGNKGQDYFWIF